MNGVGQRSFTVRSTRQEGVLIVHIIHSTNQLNISIHSLKNYIRGLHPKQKTNGSKIAAGKPMPGGRSWNYFCRWRSGCCPPERWDRRWLPQWKWWEKVMNKDPAKWDKVPKRRGEHILCVIHIWIKASKLPNSARSACPKTKDQAHKLLPQEAAHGGIKIM